MMVPPGVPFAPSPGYNPPAFNVPPGVGVLLAANVVAFGLVMLLPGHWGELLVDYGALIPARFFAAWSSSEVHRHLFDYLPFGSYMFLHGGFTHLAFNMGFLLAFGGGIERRVGRWRMLAFYLICGVLAGIGYAMIHPHSPGLLVGASGAVSGLFGGALRFLVREPKRALIAGGVWVGFTVLFGVIGDTGLTDGASIAWEAHLIGFAAGLLLFPLFFFRPRRGAAT